MAVSLCDQVRIDPILEVQVCKFKYNFKARAARGSSEELEKNAGPVHILCIPVFGTPKKLHNFFINNCIDIEETFRSLGTCEWPRWGLLTSFAVQ